MKKPLKHETPYLIFKYPFTAVFFHFPALMPNRAAYKRTGILKPRLFLHRHVDLNT